MVDYLQFEFELDHQEQTPQQELELYSCSLDSTTESLPDLHEATTPLLYEFKIPTSRNNSIVSEDVDQFQLDLPSSDYVPKTIPELTTTSTISSTPRTIISSLEQSTEDDSDLTDIIKKGSITIQNNYKRWLSTSTHSF